MTTSLTAKVQNRDANLRANGQPRSFRQPRPRRTALEIQVEWLICRINLTRSMIRDAQHLGKGGNESTQRWITWVEYALVKLEEMQTEVARVATQRRGK